MFQRIISFLKKIDWILFLLAFLLVVIGLVIQYSLILNSENADFSPFFKQVISFTIALGLFLALSYFDFRWFNNYAYLFYFISLFLLVSVLFFGQNFRGTQGWFVLGPVSFQPVEIVKIFLIIFLSKYFSGILKRLTGPGFSKIVLSGLFVFVLFALLLLQPDLGSALVLFGIWFLMYFMVNKKKLHIIIILALIFVVAISAWLFLLRDYQKERVLTFIDPNRDPLGVGYQVNQSIIAIGSGQFFGRGLGLGPQSQLRFLPDTSTDFIFSVIAEEFGLFGVLIILGLFLLLFWRIMSYTKVAYTDFVLLLIIGFLGLISLQFFVNIGMNIGLLPVTGIPLPFVSYGNSSLIAFFVALGILESIKVHRVKSHDFGLS